MFMNQLRSMTARTLGANAASPFPLGAGVLNGFMGLQNSVGAGSGAVACIGAKRWATKKAGSSQFNTSQKGPGRRMGIKAFGGHFVKANHIIARQVGFKWHPGVNVRSGKDYTLHATCDGYVHFISTFRPHRKRRKWRLFMNIIPVGSDGQDVYNTIQDKYKWYLEEVQRKRNKKLKELPSEARRKRAIAILESQGVKRAEDKLGVHYDAFLRDHFKRKKIEVGPNDYYKNIEYQWGPHTHSMKRLYKEDENLIDTELAYLTGETVERESDYRLL